MLDRIKQFFDHYLLPADETDSNNSIEFATAALFLEMARSDFEDDSGEQRLIVELLEKTFGLSGEALQTLVDLATQASEQANDLYQFTQLVNEHYTYQHKVKLVENLWRIAFVDGRLDKYEEQFIRKVAGLLHLANSDFIKAKLRAREG